jgi:hypothetical protein
VNTDSVFLGFMTPMFLRTRMMPDFDSLPFHPFPIEVVRGDGGEHRFCFFRVHAPHGFS